MGGFPRNILEIDLMGNETPKYEDSALHKRFALERLLHFLCWHCMSADSSLYRLCGCLNKVLLRQLV